MELVAFLGKDKENFGQVNALVKKGEWEKAVIVKDKNAKEIPEISGAEVISVNSEKNLLELKKEIMEKLKEKIGGSFEVALSLASGNGKEHMALISALLSIPVGVKLVAFTREGIEFVN